VTRTQYYTATSIDGYIADQDNSLDWLFEVEQRGRDMFGPFFAEVGAFAMGATTYEWALRSLPSFPGANINFVSGDVRPVHEAMVAAAQGRNIWLAGGGELVGAFADQGLLDEIILGVAPVTLGAGAALLPRRLPSPRLTLSSVEQVGQFAYLTYTVH
jgi:dihydrofolate reductase